MADTSGFHLPDLPMDFMRLVLASLDAVSVAKATAVCREWRSLGMEVWRKRTKQWHFGKSSWTALESEGLHLRLFADRWQIDKAALQALESMASPGKREEALTKLRAFGSDCLDVLLAAAHLFKGGPKDGPHLDQALTAVQAVRTAAELRSLLDNDVFDLAHLEHGALCIAQAHAPHVDVFGFVTPYLDQLAAEALARIAAMEGTPTNQQALEVVNQLLFLPRHEDHPFPFNVAAPLFPANVNHEAAWGDDTLRLNSVPLPAPSPNMWAIPPPGFGLELRGNAGDYYCASNSLLHDILGRSGMGIPISLCIIHAAVCQRIGIPVHLLRMPMHVMNGVIGASSPYQGPPARQHMSHAELAALGPSAFELYVDAFEGGRTQSWEAVVCDLSERIMLPILFPPGVLNLQGYLFRMCNNLFSVNSSSGDLASMHVVTQLATAIAPEDPQLWDSRLRASLKVQDCADAEEALRRFSMLPQDVQLEYAHANYVPSIRLQIDQVRRLLNRNGQ